MSATPLRRDVQGLRGVAVLVVVLYHAGVPLAPGGFVGVDVFFVISGYLITRLLVDEAQAHGRIDLPAFLARRARRLLPAALTTVLAVALLSLWYYPPLERDAILGAARAASLYVANLWFTLQAVDYLGGHAASNPMLHMWSLGVEEQFYLVWPLAVAAAVRWWPGPDARARAAGLVAVIGLVSLAGCVVLTSASQPWAFFGMPARAWEFALGALVCLHAQRLRALPPAVARGAAVAGVLAVLAAVLLMNDRMLFPGAWALLPAAGSALLLAGLERADDGLARRLLSQAVMVRVGDVSYAWYLVHWPVLAAVAAWTPRPGEWARALAVLASWLLAVALYRFVEQPWRRGRLALAAPWRVLFAALLGTVGAALLLTGLRRHEAGAPVDPVQARYAAARSDASPVYARGCHADFAVTRAVACEAGVAGAERTVVLLGDSHAAHWFPALERLARESGWRLLSLTKSGCPAVQVTVVNAALRRPYVECDRWREDALRRIAEAKPWLVVLGSSAAYGVPAPQWEEGLRRTLAALEGAGAGSVAVLRDTPLPGFDVPVCLARAAQRGQPAAVACAIDFDAALAPGNPIAEAERRAVAAAANARWVDMSAAICPGRHCDPEVDGLVRFSDASHLSARQSVALAAPLRRALEETAPR